MACIVPVPRTPLTPHTLALGSTESLYHGRGNQDPTAVVASSTSAGCTSEHLAVLVGFVLRCHLEAEALEGTVRREMLNTGQVRP